MKLLFFDHFNLYLQQLMVVEWSNSTLRPRGVPYQNPLRRGMGDSWESWYFQSKKECHPSAILTFFQEFRIRTCQNVFIYRALPKNKYIKLCLQVQA